MQEQSNRRPPDRPTTFTLCCVVDAHPRFYVEFILWTICVRNHLPDTIQPVAYFVGAVPADLVAWAQSNGIEVRRLEQVVVGSPHCNKIGPFFDDYRSDYTVVTDADLFFVDDPSPFFSSWRFRAPPNNHSVPPPRIFRSILEASGLGRPYRPGMAVCPGGHGIRETHINNICGSLVAAPRERREEFASTWKKWADWLIENRILLERWGVHVDQVGFAVAMEDMEEDVEFLPAQLNTILHIFKEVELPCAFHLSSAHVPQYPGRFNGDSTMNTDAVSEEMASSIEILNASIVDAIDVIGSLASTRDHRDKFLNPAWRRS